MIRHDVFIRAARRQKTHVVQNEAELLAMKEYIEQNKEHYKGSNLKKSVNKLIAEKELIEDAEIEEECSEEDIWPVNWTNYAKK